MYVSLNEMYLCELVHALKINKAKLKEVPRDKCLPSAPPHMWLSFLDHTPICHITFWGLGGIMKEDWRPRPWGTPHQWVWGSTPEAVAWLGFPRPARLPCAPTVPGPFKSLGKESCPGVAHPVGGLGQCANAPSKAFEWWVWRPMRKKSSESLKRSKLAGLPCVGGLGWWWGCWESEVAAQGRHHQAGKEPGGGV